jgi:hypothetical protein
VSALVDVLVALAVVALIVLRQIRPQRALGRRWWLVPAVLVFLAVRNPGSRAFIDAQHPLASELLLAADLLTGLLMGAAWGWTSRIWTESDGSIWVRGTRATAAVWIAGIVMRIGLAGLGAHIGVHQGNSALLLTLALSLLMRSGVLAWRAQVVHPTPDQAMGYGGDAPSVSRKDRV